MSARQVWIDSAPLSRWMWGLAEEEVEGGNLTGRCRLTLIYRHVDTEVILEAGASDGDGMRRW